jgi:gp16 family phage-associated protein
MDFSAVQALMSREDVVRDFELRGETVTSWAQKHAFNAANVYAVLTGRTRGRWGEAHRIAVALGLKPSLPEDRR